MRRVLIAVVVVIVVVLAATQVVVPRVVASRIEDRLAAGGGTVEASVSAFPAVGLAWRRGGAIRISGSGLRFEADDRADLPLERLDGFETVAIELVASEAGPVEVDEFLLRRDARDGPYRLTVRGTVTPRDLAAEIGARAGGFFGGLAGGLAGRALLSDSGMRIPLRLSSDVRSEGGRPMVIEAQASVAGLPAGPLAGFVLGAVLDRL